MKPCGIGHHGPTIFHSPEEKLSIQLGGRYAMALEAGLSVISDFRQIDILRGGQGAPLVPIGDELLFRL